MITAPSSWRGSVNSIAVSESLDEKLETLSRWHTLEEQVEDDAVKVITLFANKASAIGISAQIERLNTPSDVHRLRGSKTCLSSEDYLTRLICINAENSNRALNVTENVLRTLINQHGISLDFLQLVSHFHLRRTDLEESNYVPFTCRRSEDLIEYMYILKYPELNGRDEGIPWSLRRLGLYHQIQLSDKRSTYVLLSPLENSQAEQDLCTWLSELNSVDECRQHAFMPHEILTSRPMDNWRHSLMHYEKALGKLSMRMLGEEGKRKPATSDDMAQIHIYECLIIPLQSAFSSTKQIIGGLQQAFESHAKLSNSTLTKPEFICPGDHSWLETLQSRYDQITAYEDYANALWKKCASIASFHNGLLNLSNQVAVQEQSEYALQLGISTVVITVIFLVYLSFTAVATVLEMPLFWVDQSTGKLFVSPQIWIFFAVSVPLTAMSILFWRFRLQQKRRNMERWRDGDTSKLV